MRRPLAALVLLLLTAHGDPAISRQDAGHGSMVSIPAGAEMRREPDHESALVAVLPATMLQLLDWRGAWAKVEHGSETGWVDLERPRRAGDSAGPPPTDTDFDRLTRARQALGTAESELSLDRWRLYTDVSDRRTLDLLQGVASGAPEAYAERYGVHPTAAREAVVLLAEEESYRRFEAADRTLDDLHLDAQAAGGVAVLHAAGSSERGLARTLLHELAHLLNRRALGDELPPWLDEGLAGDLALSRIGPKGEIGSGPLDRRSIRFGPRLELHGPIVWLAPLIEARRDGSLPLRQALELDHPGFQAAADRPLLYASYAFWCRFLLQPESGYENEFRAFLASVAGGGDTSPATLVKSLGTPWGDLADGFDAWLRRLPDRLGVPRRRGSPTPR